MLFFKVKPSSPSLKLGGFFGSLSPGRVSSLSNATGDLIKPDLFFQMNRNLQMLRLRPGDKNVERPSWWQTGNPPPLCARVTLDSLPPGPALERGLGQAAALVFLQAFSTALFTPQGKVPLADWLATSLHVLPGP